MSFFITSAHAASTSAASAQPAGAFGSVIMLVGFLAIFYLLIWRPQNKRMKEHRGLLQNLSSGDEVITAGGVIGKINKITDDFLVINIANDVDIKVQKSSVTASLPQGTIKSI